MNAKTTLAAGIACLIAAQVVAAFAWPQRPAAATSEYLAADENLGEVFVEMEPGEFAGTLMLGGLRGLVTDLLWLRATGAKEDGRFYESVALFGLIAKVQPRYEQVWEFMAHDMAYNIAVEVSPEDRWNWFLAGLDAINTGVRRNPRSVRLLRFHAWMLHHKGELFMDRVERHDWTGLINPLLKRQDGAVELIPYGAVNAIDGRELTVELAEGTTEPGEPMLILAGGEVVAEATVRAVDERRVQLVLAEDAEAPPAGDLAAVGSMSNFQLAGKLYRAALALGAKQDMTVASYIRRLVALGIEKDGNRLRNRGYHRAALERYLRSLEDWQQVLVWIADPANGYAERSQRTTVASYERNEGQLRRRSAQLARKLAPDPFVGGGAARALMERDFLSARWLMSLPGWKDEVGSVGGVRWWDEVAREP